MGQITADADVMLKWQQYRKAQMAKAVWTAEEKRTKAELLTSLGYDPEDEKPSSSEVTTEAGDKVFEVKVGQRKGLDINYLRNTHPDIYAESEKTSHPISIHEV